MNADQFANETGPLLAAWTTGNRDDDYLLLAEIAALYVEYIGPLPPSLRDKQ